MYRFDGSDIETVEKIWMGPGKSALGDEFKYEILVREESFNQTATESCVESEEEE